MGNRAVLTFTEAPRAPAIYLHWNGGRASVEGFLQAARELGLRHVGEDPAATMDRLAELVAVHFFGGQVGFTVYRMPFGKTDRFNRDNGTFVLTRDMRIGDHLHFGGIEEIDPGKTASIREQIVQRAPVFSF